MNLEIGQTLPTELLLSIIDKVDDDEDLLLLATGSRHFHDLSMTEYFSRLNFDPGSKTLSFNGCVGILSGLAISLDVIGTSIDNLSYDFGYINNPKQVIREVHLLTRYVAKLSSINQVTLRLATYFPGTAKEWRTANIVLLHTVMQKSCTNVHITTSQLSSFYEEPKSLRSPRPSDWLKDYWPPGINPLTSGPKYLQRCFIQTFPISFRPFYFHTLRNNASVLTDLSFKNLFGGGGTDWATLLANVHFPRLTRLTVIYGVIPRDPFIKFLAKHRIIQEFNYHHIRYDPPPKRPAHIEKAVFERLHTLTTTPEHILNFLPPMARMPALINLVIKIEERVTNFSALEGALRCLASCLNKITLSLEITATGLGFGVWLDTIVRNGLNPSGRPEALLHCVEALIMDNGVWSFADGNITTRLPQWLRLFPALRMLTLREGGPAMRSTSSLEEGGNLFPLPAYVDALRDACPGIYIEWQQKQSAAMPLRA